MGITFKIKQKGLFKRNRKPMPFDVLLGDKLQYGTYGRGRLENEHSDDRLTAVLPHAWGRGIWVWLKEDNKGLTIGLPTPCHKAEVDELFEMVLRVAQYWRCTITVEGNKGRYSLSEIPADIKVAHAYNQSTLQSWIDAILEEPYLEDDEPNIITFIGGRHTVGFGPEEAEDCQDGILDFSEWLHEIQDTNAYYCYPDFYEWTKGCIDAEYLLVPGVDALLPYKPFALNYDIFAKTNEQAHADRWSICFAEAGGDDYNEIGKLPYDVFLEVVRQEKLIDHHDAHCFMLPRLTREDIDLILDRGHAILEKRKNNNSEDSQED